MHEQLAAILDINGKPATVVINLPSTHVNNPLNPMQRVVSVQQSDDNRTTTYTVRSRTDRSVAHNVTLRHGTWDTTLRCTCKAAQHRRPCNHTEYIANLLQEDGHTGTIHREHVRRATSKLAIKVPYNKRHLAKMHGGRWDRTTKAWLMPNAAAKTIVQAALLAA